MEFPWALQRGVENFVRSASGITSEYSASIARDVAQNRRANDKLVRLN